MAKKVINLEDRFSYNGQEYRLLGAPVVTDIDDVEAYEPPADEGDGEGEGEGSEDVIDLTNAYVLDAGVFYDIESWDSSEGESSTLVLVFNPNYGVHAGRFTAWASPQRVVWPAGTIIPDGADTEFEQGHRYEFSVYGGVLMLADVTYTAPVTEGGE